MEVRGWLVSSFEGWKWGCARAYVGVLEGLDGIDLQSGLTFAVVGGGT